MRQASPLFAMMIVPFVAHFCIKNNQDHILLKIMNIGVFIWYVVLVLEAFSFAQSGVLLFDFESYYYDQVATRNDSLRASLFLIGDVMILYNFIILYYKISVRRSEKVFAAIQFFLGMYCLLIVQQTRAATLYVVLCLFTLCLEKNRNRKRAIFNIILVLGVFLFVLFNPTVNKFLESFSMNGNYANSSKNRIYAIGYYIECFLESPLVGNGLASGNLDQVYAYVEHGSMGLAYYSDVGVFGLLGNIGAMAFIVFIIPLARMLSNCRVIFKKSNSRLDRMFSLATCEYFILSSITLLPFTSSRMIIVFPLVFAYVEICRTRLEPCIQHKSTTDEKLIR